MGGGGGGGGSRMTTVLRLSAGTERSSQDPGAVS